MAKRPKAAASEKVDWAHSAMGYGRLGPGRVHPGQTEMFPDTNQEGTPPPFRPLPGIEGLTEKQRKAGEKQLGTTLESAKARAHAFLDAAFEREYKRREADNEDSTGRVFGNGQNWYAGGEGSERSEIQRLANEHQVPFHTVAAVKATVAQNISPHQENTVADQILSQTRAGVKPDNMKTSTYGEVSRRAAQHLVHSTEDPLRVTSHPEDMGHDPSPMAMAGHKIPSYYQSYVYPHHPRTRPAIDRHMFRALAPRISNDKVVQIQGNIGKSRGVDLPDDLRQAHVEAGGIVGPAHRVLAHAVSLAAAERGLSPPEAQTLIWHEKKAQDDERMQRRKLQKSQFRLF